MEPKKSLISYNTIKRNKTLAAFEEVSDDEPVIAE